MAQHERTKCVQIGRHTYCSYCFDKALEDNEWDEYQQYTWHYCTCKSAEAEVVYNKTIVINKEKQNKLLFDNELENLKYKYNIK